MAGEESCSHWRIPTHPSHHLVMSGPGAFQQCAPGPRTRLWPCYAAWLSFSSTFFPGTSVSSS